MKNAILNELKERFSIKIEIENDNYYILNALAEPSIDALATLTHIDFIIERIDALSENIKNYYNKLLAAFHHIENKYPEKDDLSNFLLKNYDYTLDIQKELLLLKDGLINKPTNNFLPKINSIYRANLDLYHLIEGTNNIVFYKEYILNENLAFIISPKNKTEYENLNLLDLAIMRTIFSLHSNEYFTINYKQIFRIISQSNSRVVTEKQINLVKKSIAKLQNLNITIYNKKDGTKSKENLIYLANINNSEFIILKGPLLYKYVSKEKLFVKLDRKIFACSVSATETALIVKEYLIYRIILNKDSYYKYFFKDIYKHLDIELAQDKKRIRTFINEILEHWKIHGYIESYNLEKIENEFVYLEVFKK